VQKSFAAAGAQIRAVVAGFASVQTIRSIARMGQAAIQMADEIGEASVRLGIAGEDLQRFRFAAAQADVDTQKLDTALKMFQQNLAQGKISAETNDMAEAFRAYVARIAEAPTHIEKVRIAQEGLGKQFQTGLLLAGQGAEEFGRLVDSAFVISEKALQSASQLDNQMKALQGAVQTGFSTGFIESFAGALNTSTQNLNDLNAAAKNFGSAAGTGFGEAIQFARDFLKVRGSN
jgi:hypothetical protein